MQSVRAATDQQPFTGVLPPSEGLDAGHVGDRDLLQHQPAIAEVLCVELAAQQQQGEEGVGTHHATKVPCCAKGYCDFGHPTTHRSTRSFQRLYGGC